MTRIIYHGVRTGCSVSVSSTPGMTVVIEPGLYFNQNVAAVPSATSLSIVASDPTQDRYDLISADTAGNVSATPGSLGLFSDGTAFQPDTTDTIFGYIPVAAGLTAVGDIQDARTYVNLSEPTNSMVYTFDSATASVDPGYGKFRFNSSVNTLITHCYISYYNPAVPLGVHSAKSWLVAALAIKFWSRKSPGEFLSGRISAFTDHSTYADLTISTLKWSVADLGPVSGNPPLSTDTYDTICESVWA